MILRIEAIHVVAEVVWCSIYFTASSTHSMRSSWTVSATDNQPPNS